jgi:hypothetical protein
VGTAAECRKRQRRKSTKKRRTRKDKYHGSTAKPPTETLDGTLFFPDIGILIHSDLHYFDTLSIAKQVGHQKDQAAPGLLHMVINPKNAFQLEQDGYYPKGQAKFIELLNEDVLVLYPSVQDPTIQIKRLIQVIVVDSVKAADVCGSKKFKGTDWISGDEMVKAVEYLGASHVDTAKA